MLEPPVLPAGRRNAQIMRSNTSYRANYLPGMMGQQWLCSNSSLQTIEATLARTASLNAGSGETRPLLAGEELSVGGSA